MPSTALRALSFIPLRSRSILSYSLPRYIHTESEENRSNHHNSLAQFFVIRDINAISGPKFPGDEYLSSDFVDVDVDTGEDLTVGRFDTYPPQGSQIKVKAKRSKKVDNSDFFLSNKNLVNVRKLVEMPSAYNVGPTKVSDDTMSVLRKHEEVLSKHLEEAIAKMYPRQREAFKLIAFTDLSLRQICWRMRPEHPLAPATVVSHMVSAIEQGETASHRVAMFRAIGRGKIYEFTRTDIGRFRLSKGYRSQNTNQVRVFTIWKYDILRRRFFEAIRRGKYGEVSDEFVGTSLETIMVWCKRNYTKESYSFY
ncbi:hypothetical protein C8Q75DRAFT_789160 [Abortiporus biennis]|nr:hypothetical protein C8Q75DRAFT_789160 [Abortiporus biennis]